VYNIPLATNLATAEAIVGNLVKNYVAHLIFNPVAGQGNAQQELATICNLLEPHMTLKVSQTTPEVTAEQLTEAAIASQPSLVIASGGDGTVSAVASNLINTGIPLGMIPRGTANAFASALKIPLALNPIRSACEVILAGHTRVVDAARCNGAAMILLAGIGYEAETVEKANRELKDQWGVLAYLMAGWQQLDEQTLFETEIEIEDSTQRFQAAAITIANAAPLSSVLAQGAGQVVVNDGLLDVTIATHETKFQAITTMISMLGSALVKLNNTQQNVTYFSAKKIKVTTDPPQKVVLDGEIIGTTPVEFESLPGALTVFAPPE
ncbi:MAG TPA: YegS/Rv2252/BmrU family lipid kinase, partial [Chroococcidiopsis sp.]